MRFIPFGSAHRVACVTAFLILAGIFGLSTSQSQSTASTPVGQAVSIDAAAPDSTVAADGSGCDSDRFCSWTSRLYRGAKYVKQPCVGVVDLVPYQSSAKNRCNKDVRLLYREGGSVNGVACMEPGGNRPTPGRFNRVDFSDVTC